MTTDPATTRRPRSSKAEQRSRKSQGAGSIPVGASTPLSPHAARDGADLSVCRGCNIVFLVPVGAAGDYCSRACYTNPFRINRAHRLTR